MSTSTSRSDVWKRSCGNDQYIAWFWFWGVLYKNVQQDWKSCLEKKPVASSELITSVTSFLAEFSDTTTEVDDGTAEFLM